MSDDIVTRLREACVNFGDDYHNEAADEIERLRADIEERVKLMSKITELLLPFSLLMNKDEQTLLIKAVRGD